MNSGFTDGDVGKRVETTAGEPIGVVKMTGDETAYVDLEEGVMDSITAVLDWDGDTEHIVPIGVDSVREVTGDAIHLEGETTRNDFGERTDPVLERNETTGSEDEGSERRQVETPANEDGEADEMRATGEGRSGEGMEPATEEMNESGAERHPDSEDQPPEGDRTVTKERGEEENR
ncbi:hypothetical protein [Natronorubrum halophilum]|uniref:hypothetical protein n=1 Tax=Natronorubrum halophilum TaxID=1702106 RepID=UPI0010C1CEE5|nr:hypothetical protein [Natronorubrum halophilum]